MTTDRECVRFLQWCLPRMRLSWKGFRKVRRQVCRRISKRKAELSIVSFFDYQDYLMQNVSEWDNLRHCCRVSISRFYRDRAVFNALRWEVIPSLVRQNPAPKSLRVWSCGCASGEEPFTLSMIWDQLGYEDCTLEIVATDIDGELLRRAEAGVYGWSSLRELPTSWKTCYFERVRNQYKIVEPLRTPVVWLEQDLLSETPVGLFDLVLCRHLVFTYYELDLQREILSRIALLIRAGGALVLGQTEELPASDRFLPWTGSVRIYRRS